MNIISFRILSCTFAAASLWGLAGCASYEAERETNALAQRHMAVADSLERTGNLRDAAFEYGLIAQHYAGTAPYRDALHKAALLYLDPRSPASNDSTGMHWLTLYLSQPEVAAQQDTQMASLLVQRLTFAWEQVQRLATTADSLSSVVRRQSAAVFTQNQRLQETENELRQTRKELLRLKEVDERLSGHRRRP